MLNCQLPDRGWALCEEFELLPLPPQAESINKLTSSVTKDVDVAADKKVVEHDL